VMNYKMIFAMAATVLGLGLSVGYPLMAGSEEIKVLKESFRRPSQIPLTPSDNRVTEAKYYLGRQLFFDPRLSQSNMISCASCHNPSLSWGNGLARGVGHGHAVLGRKVPTLYNAAWSTYLFWDGRAEGLEDQALGPIQAPLEMNMPLPQLVKKLGKIQGYVEQFNAVFPEAGLSAETIAKAIATYERSIISAPSRFDRWVEGDEEAISDSAKRGFVLFNGKANCVACHTGWNFTNGSFADVGIAGANPDPNANLGRMKEPFFFKTPTLIGIHERGPYMHDGSVATLEAVIENYDQGGVVKRHLVGVQLKKLGLSIAEKKDLISFLKALSPEDKPVSFPVLPVR